MSYEIQPITSVALPSFHIQADPDGVWNSAELKDLLLMEFPLYEAHMALAQEAESADGLCGWLHLPSAIPENTIREILSAAAQIRASGQALVVVSDADCSLGASAAIQLLCGSFSTMDADCRIYFCDTTLCSRALYNLYRRLADIDYSLLLIGKDVSSLEHSVASRGLRMQLTRKYGPTAARQRLYIVTGASGALHNLALSENCPAFEIPAKVSDRFSLFTAGGLLPMAVAGIDIRSLLLGAKLAEEALDARDLENPAWNYAAVRNMLMEKGFRVEMLSCGDPAFHGVAEWWQRLFSVSEAGVHQGIFPASAQYRGELPASAHFPRGDAPYLFETMVRFDSDQKDLPIELDWKDTDGLNALVGRTVGELDAAAYDEIFDRRTDSGIPVMQITCGELNARTLGELFYFFQLSAALSARAMGIPTPAAPDAGDFREKVIARLPKK